MTAVMGSGGALYCSAASVATQARADPREAEPRTLLSSAQQTLPSTDLSDLADQLSAWADVATAAVVPSPSYRSAYTATQRKPILLLSSLPSTMSDGTALRAMFTACILIACLLPLTAGLSPLLSHLHPRPPVSTSNGYSHLLGRHDALGRRYRQMDSLGLLPPLPSTPAPAQYFTQRLDHFDRSNDETWQQRYFVNDSLWDGQGPVFFLVGWEGPMASSYVAGAWAINSFAEQFRALIVCLEHRFYGQSIPGNDTDIARLRYLTSEQALEDAADWAVHINAQYAVPATSKWVAMGGSYSGFLAGAARAKYPHLYAGALAVSGPVQAQVDYVGYNEVVGQALGPTCEAALRSANDRVTQLLSSAEGEAQLAKDFNLCQPLSDPISQAIFVSTWSYELGGIVQYAENDTVAQWCRSFQAAGGGDPYQALVELWFPKRTRCYGGFDFDALVKDSKRPGDDRSWAWQTCAEWGSVLTHTPHTQHLTNIHPHYRLPLLCSSAEPLSLSLSVVAVWPKVLSDRLSPRPADVVQAERGPQPAVVPSSVQCKRRRRLRQRQRIERALRGVPHPGVSRGVQQRREGPLARVGGVSTEQWWMGQRGVPHSQCIALHRL